MLKSLEAQAMGSSSSMEHSHGMSATSSMSGRKKKKRSGSLQGELDWTVIVGECMSFHVFSLKLALSLFGVSSALWTPP